MEVLFAEFAIFVDIVESEKELNLSLSVVELCYCTGTYRSKCGEQCCKLKVNSKISNLRNSFLSKISN